MTTDSEKQLSATGEASDEEKKTGETTGGAGSLLCDFLDIVESVLLSVFVVLLVFAFLLRPVTVDGSSMNPTLYDEDKLIMVSLLYTPDNGDVVIINDEKAGHFSDTAQTQLYQSDGMGIRLVKRVIALGGQTLDIDFHTGTVTLDGQVLDEPYVAELTTRNDGAFTYPLQIPEGYVFVMGDNRQHSADSRNGAVALVPEEQILGRAVLRFFRLDKLCSTWTDRFAILN